MARKSRGFTLLELLMVVGIIALLLAILLPSLAKVREQTKTALCASNMRQISHLVIEFGAEHDGRGPNGGSNAQGGTIMNEVSNTPTFAGDPYAVVSNPTGGGGSVDWTAELDTWVLGRSTSSSGNISNYGIDRFGQPNATIATKTLTCPNFVVAGNHQAFGYNFDASGGTNFPTGDKPPTYYPVCGVYGVVAPPPKNYTLYWLGAKLARFNSNQFMFVEQDHANPTVGVRSGNGEPSTGIIPDPPSPATGGGMGDDPANSPLYSGFGGEFSFRHPYYMAGIGKGNFVFFDGHVELLRPKDNINSAYRLSLGAGQ